MKKLIALLLLSPITQASFVEELYESKKNDLTHIECKAFGERTVTLVDQIAKKSLQKTDYFSFQTDDNFPYLFMKLQDAGYINTLVAIPSLEEEGKFEYVNDSYKILSFNDESLVFYFEEFY